MAWDPANLLSTGSRKSQTVTGTLVSPPTAHSTSGAAPARQTTQCVG